MARSRGLAHVAGPKPCVGPRRLPDPGNTRHFSSPTPALPCLGGHYLPPWSWRLETWGSQRYLPSLAWTLPLPGTGWLGSGGGIFSTSSRVEAPKERGTWAELGPVAGGQGRGRETGVGLGSNPPSPTPGLRWWCSGLKELSVV